MFWIFPCLSPMGEKKSSLTLIGPMFFGSKRRSISIGPFENFGNGEFFFLSFSVFSIRTQFDRSDLTGRLHTLPIARLGSPIFRVLISLRLARCAKGLSTRASGDLLEAFWRIAPPPFFRATFVMWRGPFPSFVHPVSAETFC